MSVEVLVRGVDDAQRVDSGLEIKAFCKSLGSLWPDMWGMPRNCRALGVACRRLRRGTRGRDCAATEEKF